MPFPSTLSVSDYSRIRAGIYNAERYLVVFTGSIMMQFHPSVASNGKSNSSISYSGVLSGGTTNVIINMTVLITPSSDYVDDLQTRPEDCLISYTRQSPTASLFYIGETAFQWTTASFVTVLSEWRVHEKRTIISSDVIYKNVSIARQNPRPRIYDLYDDVVVTSASSVSYSPTPNAVAMTSGGSISSWSWDKISNGTVTKTASSSQNPTFTLALGIHWLVLTVTDNGGLTHTLAVKVAVVPRNFDSVVENALVETIQYDMNNGASAGISKFDSASTLVPGSPCLAFDHIDYTNGITEDNLMISGWLGGEVQLNLQGSDEWGQIKTFQDSIKTIRALAETIRLASFPIREKTTPSVWGDMTRTGVYDAIWYIVSEHSTVANVSAQDFPSDYASYRFPSLNTPGGTLPDVLDSLAFRASGDMISYAPHGEMIYVKSLFYETSSSNRDNATVYGSFTINDGARFNSQRSAPGLFGMSVILCGLATYNTSSKTPRAYRSQAPAGFVPTVLLEELDGIIMAADLSDANAIIQAGKFAANHFFAGTDSIQLTADFITGYLFFPRGDAWVKMTLAATDTLDGSSFDTTNDRFLMTQMQSQWDSETYYIVNSITWRRETDGGDNYANETAFLPIGTIQTVPTYPVQNGYPDLSDYETMSDTYGPDYSDNRDGWEDNSLPPENAANEGIANAQALETLYIPFTGGAVSTSFLSTLGTDNYLIKVSNDAELQQAFSTNVTVDATTNPFSGGGATGVNVISGQSVTFAAAGSWSLNGTKFFDADGGTTTNPSAILPSAKLAAMVGKVGSSGSWFNIGKNNTLSMPDTGELYLVTNDINAYTDNAGSQSVDISATTIRGDAFYWKYNIGTATAYSGANGLNLDGAGIVHGNSYNSGHSYEFTIDGTGSEFTFSFTDPDGIYSDNSNANIKVEIFLIS